MDLTGYSVEDAVKIIRGTKGTEVRLTLKKPDGTSHVVSLIREEIVQDELTFARSAIVNSAKGKIGYIYLPEFYADFDNPKGNRCSIDVAKEVMKLKAEKVDGIVLDLRNNGGGSLSDVVQMAGLFVEQGPIVQVRSRDEKPQVYPDHDKSVLWDGPFAVMVNELSASASEIFAAAIQDYHRGVIIGSSSTYGKGTVQRPIGLDKSHGPRSHEQRAGDHQADLTEILPHQWRLHPAPGRFLRYRFARHLSRYLRVCKDPRKGQSRCPALGRDPEGRLHALEICL